MNDDLTTLASSYLDSDVTAGERAQVEHDEALVAEVERLRQVRAVLGDTDTAPISVRERHLAAALDAWDRLPAAERTGQNRDATPIGSDAAAAAGAASVTAPTSLRDRRARRSGNAKMLSLAAGLVLVLAGGLVLRTVLRDGTQGSTSADAPSVESETLQGRDILDQAAADETFAADDTTAAAPEPPAEFDASEPAAASADEATILGGDAGPPDDDLELLRSTDDLAVFANDYIAARAVQTDVAANNASADAQSSAEPSATFEPAFSSCDGLVDEIVGPALYEDGLFDESIVVGIDTARQEAIAYREADCTVVARIRL